MFIEIVDREERITKRFGDSVIYMRRIDAFGAEELGRADEKDRRGEIINQIIIDWENVRHPVTKEAIPCTRENKLRLPQGILLEILREAQAPATGGASEEEQLKNLRST